MMLLGLPLEDAQLLLEREGLRWKVERYASAKPYEDADSERVVRTKIDNAGVCRLTVCAFKTNV